MILPSPTRCLPSAADDVRWGAKGHSLVHQEAMDTLPEGMPDFFLQAGDRVVSLASEPDRWKIKGLPHLKSSTTPEHHLAYELCADKPLPADRYQMAIAADKAGQPVAQVGLLPYRVAELYQTLTAEFALWRNEVSQSGAATVHAHQFQENAIYNAGLLGHFIGDASQPLHSSIHYDCWSPSVPNPNGYRTARGLHRQFETLLVNAAVDEKQVHQQIAPPQRLQGDPLLWGLDFVKESNSQVEPLFQLEKTGAFEPEHPTPAGVDFVTSRIARGAQNLRNVWYSAWLDSEKVAQDIAHDVPE